MNFLAGMVLRMGALTAVPVLGPLMWVLAGVKALFRQVVIGFKECVLNPRVFIIVGLACLGAHWRGYDVGYGSGKGDLDTYRKSAEILAATADRNASAAMSAGRAAEKAERALILAENKSHLSAQQPLPAKPVSCPAQKERVTERVIVKACPKQVELKSWWADLAQ